MKFKKAIIGILALSFALTGCGTTTSPTESSELAADDTTTTAISSDLTTETTTITTTEDTETELSIIPDIEEDEEVTELTTTASDIDETELDFAEEEIPLPYEVDNNFYSEEDRLNMSYLQHNLVVFYLTGNFKMDNSFCPSWRENEEKGIVSQYQSEAPDGYIAVDYYQEMHYNEDLHEDGSLLSIAQASDTIFASEETYEVPFYVDHCFVKPLEYDKIYVTMGVDGFDLAECRTTSCDMYTYVSTTEDLETIYCVKAKLENIDHWTCMYCDKVEDFQKVENATKLAELRASDAWVCIE